jgi:hypothetical protein
MLMPLQRIVLHIGSSVKRRTTEEELVPEFAQEEPECEARRGFAEPADESLRHVQNHNPVGQKVHNLGTPTSDPKNRISSIKKIKK